MKKIFNTEINEDNTIYLIKGDHFQFDLSEFAEEILELIDFTSSDEKVLSIDKKGKIKTHKVGESIVTLKVPFVNVETIFLVKVMELEDFNIAVSPDFISEALEVLADQEFELTTSIDEYINLEDFITWEVDDPSMAEIIDGNKIKIFSKLGKLDIKLKTLAGDTLVVSVNVVGKKY